MGEFYQRPITIVHFDAHPDLYPNFQENPFSHASPFARILEQPGLCSQLISFGIRTSTPIQTQIANKYRVFHIHARDYPNEGYKIGGFLEKLYQEREPLVYLSIDMDVLDPAFAPGVSHREPGGLSTRQLIDAIHSIPGNFFLQKL